jgi:hypothetical protein
MLLLKLSNCFFSQSTEKTAHYTFWIYFWISCQYFLESSHFFVRHAPTQLTSQVDRVPHLTNRAPQLIVFCSDLLLQRLNLGKQNLYLLSQSSRGSLSRSGKSTKNQRKR